QIAAGGQILHERTVDLREALEVELLEGFARAEGARRMRRANFFCSRRATSSWISSARNSVYGAWSRWPGGCAPRGSRGCPRGAAASGAGRVQGRGSSDRSWVVGGMGTGRDTAHQV